MELSSLKRLVIQTLSVACALIAGIAAKPAFAQTKDAEGYWKYVETVWVETPEEKVHKVYPVKFTIEGNKLTAIAKALNGNNLQVVNTEEVQEWTWTPPPQILVPGEKFPMKFELKLERPTFNSAVGFYIGGRINAGFLPPKPKDAAAFHVGADTRTEKGEKGGLDPRAADQGGAKFAPATYSIESFVAVPGRKNPTNVKEYPDQMSFRVGGVIGNTREFNTIYEYKWMDGPAPEDRGTPVGETPPGKTPDSSSGTATASGKWEYKILDIPLNQTYDTEKFQKTLADLGDEGWELVSIYIPPLPPNTSPTDIRLVFKRPKK